MKYIAVFIILLTCTLALGQDKANKNLPKIEFEELLHDFGEIPYGGNGDYDFVFKNVGKGPLIIKKAKAS